MKGEIMARPRIAIAILLSAAMALLSCASGERVDLLVTGGTVLTMDAERTVLEDGAVAILREKIVAVGTTADLAARYRPRRRIYARGALILPGLINGHTHAAMSLYRGAADDLALEEWLTGYIFPLEAELTTADMVYWGTLLASREMIRGGVTTFADRSYFEDEAARAASLAGIRIVAGETVLDFPAPDFKTPRETLAWTEKFIEEWKDDPLVIPAIAPHSAYTLSPEMLTASAELARRTGAPLLIHVAETQSELGEVRKKRKQSPVAYLAGLGVFDVPALAAHCVWVDERDRALLAEKGVGCVHNPSSNMKLASGISPVGELRGAGVAVGLGTDGPAGSNNDFNLFEEMDLAAKLAKVSRMDPTALPAPEVVAMATIEGARALGLGDRLGSLEAGKLADLILVRRDGFHAQPYFDSPYSQLVYALKARDVETSIIHGRIVMERGRIRALDDKELRRKLEEFAGMVREVLARGNGKQDPGGN